jgi:hypothetical protein
LLVFGGCLACGNVDHNARDEPASGSGGAAAGAAGHASAGVSGVGGSSAAPNGGAAGTGGKGGAPAVGGEGGVAGRPSNMAGDGSALGGDGALAGAAGSGDTTECNDVALIESNPSCTTLGVDPLPQGGTLLEGIYTLVAYESEGCGFVFEQTIRVQQIAVNTYRLDTVTNVQDVRANATLVRAGTILSSTSICGADEVDVPYGYSAYEDQGVAYLRLINKGSFTYRRVS